MFLRLFNCYRPTLIRRFASSAYAQPGRRRSLAWSSVFAISAGLAFGTPYKIYLDSQPNVVESDTIGDYKLFFVVYLLFLLAVIY